MLINSATATWLSVFMREPSATTQEIDNLRKTQSDQILISSAGLCAANERAAVS